MATVTPSFSIPLPALTGALVVLVVSLAYAIWIGAPVAWLVFVFALGMVSLAAYLVYLFYRLVIAVERIAAELGG